MSMRLVVNSDSLIGGKDKLHLPMTGFLSNGYCDTGTFIVLANVGRLFRLVKPYTAYQSFI